MKKIIALVVSIFICCSYCIAEDVKSFVDEDGMTHFVGQKTLEEKKEADEKVLQRRQRNLKTAEKDVADPRHYLGKQEEGKGVQGLDENWEKLTKGEELIGMNKGKVRGILGQPSRIDKGIDAWGVMRKWERWIYPGRSEYEVREVTFDRGNNIVKEWSEY